MRKILLLLAVLGFTSMSVSALDINFPKPTAEIEDFDIESISLRDVTFLFVVKVKNPYPVDLKLKGVKIKFSVEGHQLFETETSRGFKVKAKKTADNRFTVNLKYADIIAIIKDYKNKDYLKTMIDTEIIIPTPRIVRKGPIPDSFSFKYKLTQDIPAIKPTITIAHFSVQQPSPDEVKRALIAAGKSTLNPEKTAAMIGDLVNGRKTTQIIDPSTLDLKLKVNFDIELENESKASLSFTDLDYDFLVNSAPLVKGNTKKIAYKGAKQILTVENEFSTKALAGPVKKAFSSREGLFALKGSTFLKLPDSVKKKPVKLQYNENGNFKLN